MQSLRQFLPVLAEIFGSFSETALYERQRELVRAKLLKASGGRGPTSGVPISADAVAVMILSVMATDNLSEIAIETKALCQLRHLGEFDGDVPDRAAFTLRQFVGASLRKNTLSQHRLASLRYVRSHRDASAKLGATGMGHLFTSKNPWAPKGNLFVLAELHGHVLEQIFQALHSEGDVASRISLVTELKRASLERRAQFWRTIL